MGFSLGNIIGGGLGFLTGGWPGAAAGLLAGGGSSGSNSQSKAADALLAYQTELIKQQQNQWNSIGAPMAGASYSDFLAKSGAAPKVNISQSDIAAVMKSLNGGETPDAKTASALYPKAYAMATILRQTNSFALPSAENPNATAVPDMPKAPETFPEGLRKGVTWNGYTKPEYQKKVVEPYNAAKAAYDDALAKSQAVDNSWTAATTPGVGDPNATIAPGLGGKSTYTPQNLGAVVPLSNTLPTVPTEDQYLLKPTTITPRATGGTVNPSNAYLVGEQGPELLVPKTQGTILNAPVTAGVLNAANSAGGPTITNQALDAYRIATQNQGLGQIDKAYQRAAGYQQQGNANLGRYGSGSTTGQLLAERASADAANQASAYDKSLGYVNTVLGTQKTAADVRQANATATMYEEQAARETDPMARAAFLAEAKATRDKANLESGTATAQTGNITADEARRQESENTALAQEQTKLSSMKNAYEMEADPQLKASKQAEWASAQSDYELNKLKTDMQRENVPLEEQQRKLAIQASINQIVLGNEQILMQLDPEVLKAKGQAALVDAQNPIWQQLVAETTYKAQQAAIVAGNADMATALTPVIQQYMNSAILASGNARQANQDTGYFISGLLDAFTKKSETSNAQQGASTTSLALSAGNF